MACSRLYRKKSLIFNRDLRGATIGTVLYRPSHLPKIGNGHIEQIVNTDNTRSKNCPDGNPDGTTQRIATLLILSAPSLVRCP